MSGKHAKPTQLHTTFGQADLDHRFEEAAKWIRAFRTYYEQFDQAGSDKNTLWPALIRISRNITGIITDIDIVTQCLTADGTSITSETIDKIRILHSFQASMRQQLDHMSVVLAAQRQLEDDISSIERYANKDR